MPALGVLAGLAAAMCFSFGVALQALEARSAAAARSMHLSLLTTLLRRPRWAAGLLLAGVGVVLQVVALANASFVVVQAALAAGLLVLLIVGVRVLGEQVGGAAIAGTVSLIGGIALVAWGAPDHSDAHRGLVAAVAVVGSLAALAAIPFALRARHLPVIVLILGAAVGISASNVATKLMADHLAAGEVAAALTWLVAAGVTGVAGLLGTMSALQRGLATQVVPISFAVQTFLPILLGPLFLKERWSSVPLDGAPLAAGLALVLVGILAVASTRAVGAVSAPA